MPKRTIEGEGKKSPLNMRTTPELRRRLEEAAAASGRSLVQETEFRLEKSFAEEEFNRVAALSTSTFLLAKDVAKAAALAEALTGEEWTKPGRARQALKAAIQELIEPTGDAERSESDNRTALANAILIVGGEKSADTELSAGIVGRHIADAITKPRLRMGGIFGLESSSEKKS